MSYRIAAEFVIVLHLGFIVLVTAGGLLARRWAWWPWLHVPAVLWTVVMECAGWTCPLTPLENWLRRRGDLAGYEGGFIEHYLLPLIYPGALTRPLQLALGLAVLTVNLAVYAWVWRAARRRP